MVQLIPMSEAEFQDYLSDAIKEYAQEHVTAGNWHPSEALAKSEKEYQQLLPDGPSSKNQYLYAIQDKETGSMVGMLWFAVKEEPPKSVFIYDFRIYEEYRRRGYAIQSLQAVEEKVKQFGINTISLHVFGHNQAAIALYKKAGFETTNILMTKKLSA